MISPILVMLVTEFPFTENIILFIIYNVDVRQKTFNYGHLQTFTKKHREELKQRKEMSQHTEE